MFRTEPPVIASTVLVSMLLTALGGGWFPLEITGPAFQTVAHLQPTAWILDAFHGIILKGWDVSQVLPAVGVTSGLRAGVLRRGGLALPLRVEPDSPISRRRGRSFAPTSCAGDSSAA